jgi:hypothetical protein
VIGMIVYFVLSIINSLAQTYYSENIESKKDEDKTKVE